MNRLATQVKELSRQLGDIKGDNGEGTTAPSFKRLEKENELLKSHVAASALKIDELSRTNTSLAAQIGDDGEKLRDCESRSELCAFSKTKLQETLQSEESHNAQREGVLMQQMHSSAEKLRKATKRVHDVEDERDVVAAKAYDTLISK